MILALTQQPSVLWYFARAAGFVSLLLLAATVALGLAVTLRWRSKRWPTFISEALHRYLSTVLYVFIGIHVVTILFDPFTKFSLVDVLVPFVANYRPFWMGLGIASAELGLALGLSIYIRPLIGYKAWRVLHYITYVTFPLAFLHGLYTGTDTRTWWGILVYAVAGGTVAVLFAARFIGADSPGATLSPATPARR